MDRKLLDLLVCPATHQPLHRLDAAQRERINAAIAQGELRRGDGAIENRPLDDALARRDGKAVYRIEDGIPVLLVDEALDTRGIDALGLR
ncbi:Trm112 family protein [Silanimonas sp.]|uniref:Trm112 family protein n=1 Tax=Silanimonas sp. TaxID=1929290 RepID=UPI001BB8565A|nr:Trm112 family protein [Silanimonas sp.]MBS3897052.1 Trm112 family protein [Silanimonas sp.]MBS3923998.1 Trm112 family protein [Xanthomonadaceae bacterium]